MKAMTNSISGISTTSDALRPVISLSAGMLNGLIRREVDPLLKIKDAYPKMILTRSRQEAYQHEGVQIVDVADWLLKGI